MNDDLRNQLRGMADGAAERTSDLDTGRLVEFVGAARRRRDRRQKIGVGGLALALVGGVAYGGIQIFGGDSDGPSIVGPGKPSDNVYCGWNAGEGWPERDDAVHMLSNVGANITYFVILERVEVIMGAGGALVFPPVASNLDSVQVHERSFELAPDSGIYEIGMYSEYMVPTEGSPTAGEVMIQFALNIAQVRISDSDVEAAPVSMRLLTDPITIHMNLSN